MAPTKLHESYAHMMSARYGWPFYEPPSSQLVCPGKCGYIDEQGSWNPIIDLCGDPNEFARLGLSAPSKLPDKAPSEKGIQWGPKYSDKVVGRRIELSAGADASSLGLPVGLAAVFQIESTTDNGAVLLTEPNIWRDGYYHSHEFEVWVKQNSEAILKARPEVRERGIWVVKWTYTTKKCSINAWINHGRALTVGFSTNVTPVGEIGPKGEWTESSSDSGWSHFTTEGDERKVVFMGGLFFRWKRLARTGNHLTPENPSRSPLIFRNGGGSNGSIVDIEGEKYEMSMEHVGMSDTITPESDGEDLF